MSMTSEYELSLTGAQPDILVAGMDEVGRGPLAGPVVAACVIMPLIDLNPEVRDSKKISEKKRERLSVEIRKSAIGWALGVVEPDEIDRINILNATKQAFEQAYRKLEPKPDFLLIDGKDAIAADCETKAIVKGDDKIYTIAAASIVAKVYRDRLMIAYDEQYPQYGFAKHKGYGTKEHIEALKKYGPCKIHRRSFLTKILGERL